MPVLQLSGDAEDDVLYVSSIMAYPNDKAHREQYYLVHALAEKLKSTADSAEVTVDKKTLEKVINSPSLEQLVEGAKKPKRGGGIAGNVLALVWQMHRCGYEEPSIRKAIYALTEYYRKYKKPEIEVGCTEPSIRGHWEAYKAVAHLWAAAVLFQYKPGSSSLHEIKIGSDLLPTFLGYAEQFRVFGESFLPSHQHKPEPILPIGETWRVPDDWAIEVPEVELKGLPKWLTECLAGYSKRQYE